MFSSTIGSENFTHKFSEVVYNGLSYFNFIWYLFKTRESTVSKGASASSLDFKSPKTVSVSKWWLSAMSVWQRYPVSVSLKWFIRMGLKYLTISQYPRLFWWITSEISEIIPIPKNAFTWSSKSCPTSVFDVVASVM